jgi:hypothetical protein
MMHPMIKVTQIDRHVHLYMDDMFFKKNKV